MKVFKAYKTELDPTNAQRTSLLKHAGAARFAFNWGLAIKKQAMEAKEKIPNAIELHRRLNELKKTELAWMYESSKSAPQEALRNLDRAFVNFFRRCKAKKNGSDKGKVGFPKFKSKKRGIGSFRATESVRVFEKAIQLPRLRRLRLKEHGYIPTEGVKVLSATVSERAGRWFVSVQVEQDMSEQPSKEKNVVGVDLGLKNLATCSDGTTFENPKALGKRLKKLKRLSRAVSRKVKGSKNRKKAARKLGRFYHRISNIRKDVLHKVTTALTTTKSAVVIEDLDVSEMMKNPMLARSISDVGLYEFRRQLDYKGKLYGCEIVVADRFFPSSKMCHVCGDINQNLTLSIRSWMCSCGAVHNRDENAAKNLEKLAVSSTERINACGGSSPLAAA